MSAMSTRTKSVGRRDGDIASYLRAATLALLCAFVCGCPSKKEEPPKPDPSSPEVYMRDKEFRGKLAAERREHVALIRERNAVADKMKAMVEAKMAELKTEDLKKVKSALDADPAWQELYARCTNANAKVEAHSRKRLGIVRDRIAPRKSPVGRRDPSPPPTTTKQPVSK